MILLRRLRTSGGSDPLRRLINLGNRSSLQFYSTSVSAQTAEDELDISHFGTYELVLPEDPTAEGVTHIQTNQKYVPAHIIKPHYAFSGREDGTVFGDSIFTLGSLDEIAMRRAATLAKQVLSSVYSLVKVGATTASIDRAVHDFIVEKGAYPSPLMYSGFPKSCCTSVNNVIAHGIPDNRPLQDGDIINVDVTVFLGGFHGDCSRTFLVGNVDEQGQKLVEMSNLALDAGINVCGPGKPFKGIGHAITHLAKSRGFSVSSEFTGHGIGRQFHRAPWILHHQNDEPGVMLPGHCFTIEPSIVQGDDARGWMLPDGWTVLTETGARSAQAEHTILITETGVDVLTG